VIISSSNAVNLTDGLDGLAAGSGTFCFGVLAIIGYWQFRHFSIYHLHAALDLGLVGVGLVGACLGFLWWNAAPRASSWRHRLPRDRHRTRRVVSLDELGPSTAVIGDSSSPKRRR